LAGERLFFEGDNSSGVSGDLESATTIASLMEGHWGMGSTISSHASNRRFEVGAPGGGKGPDQNDRELRRALSDRIEDNLNQLLERVEQLLKQNRQEVLALAHALETYKTLPGDDVAAVINCENGTLADGRPYADASFMNEIEAYHKACVSAHREHRAPEIPLPTYKTA
jgi:ATP-dependent Zn protease